MNSEEEIRTLQETNRKLQEWLTAEREKCDALFQCAIALKIIVDQGELDDGTKRQAIAALNGAQEFTKARLGD